MAVQTVFKRYELKYLLTLAQKETVLKAMEPYMTLDKYGRTTIRNLYYDTDTYLLIRRSIEKPAYKEKLVCGVLRYISKIFKPRVILVVKLKLERYGRVKPVIGDIFTVVVEEIVNLAGDLCMLLGTLLP